jgi:O-glycosyl hydrolase
LKQLTLYLLLALAATANAATLTIDGSQTYQTIDGFGVNANHRSWTNNELKPVLDSLIDQAGMTLFRVLYDKADWESTNDNSDPNVMNWTYYNSVYSAADFQKLWDMMAYLNQRGITNGLMLNFQGAGPQWMGGSPLTPGFEDEWAEMVASLFVYARNNRHLKFTLVAPDNEPDITVQGVDMTSTQYVTAMRKVGQLLDANGMSDIRFVGPDLSSTSTTWLSAMMNDSTLAPKIARFGFHDYSNGGGIAGVYDFLLQSAYPDRSLWVTEFNVWCSACEDGGGGTNSWTYARGTADYLLSDLANGASAAFVWEGYDSQYNYYCPGCWSYWGLFGVDNINATPKTYTPRKQFYTVAQISKFVRPGARRIDVSGSFGSLTLLAFYHPGLRQLTLTGDNTGGTPAVLNGTLTSLPTASSLELYYTSADANLSHNLTVAVSNQAFSVTLPPDCIFTLSSASIPTVPSGSYSGLFIDTNGASPSSSGSLTLSVTPRQTFTGALQLAGKRYPLSGRFALNGQTTKIISRPGLSPLTVSLEYHQTQNTDEITGTITSDTWSSDVLACRATFDPRTNPAPQAGRYTIAFPGNSASTTEPNGDGNAALTVAQSGQIRALGSFADGTRFTTSSWLSNDGLWPVCLFPYAGNGLFIGWQALSDPATNDPAGLLTWIKPATANARFYPGGFTNDITTLLSGYSPPAKGQPVLSFTNADLVLLGGPLAQPITNHIALGLGNKVSSPDHATLAFSLSSGTFRGSALDPDHVRIPIAGVILTNQSLGDGYFLDSNLSGQILLISR